MLPVSTTNMEDVDICRSLRQHPISPPASAVRVIKATDFSIAAIIGNSKPAVTPQIPESAGKPIFHFGKFFF